MTPDQNKTSGSRSLLHDLALKAERLWDRVRPRDDTPEPVIDSYMGYATPQGCVLRGRVLDQHRFSSRLDAPSRLNAFRNMLRNFLTNEMAGVNVASGRSEAVTDEEGYFQLVIPSKPEGLQTASLSLPDHESETQAVIQVPSTKAEIGIISDIDDTVMRTGAYWLPRNLWTTATTFVSNREVFQDTAEFIRHFEAGRNPVFYVSSSPWNLHAYLNQVFESHDVPKGPFFLRDLGISETQFIKSSHGSHKGDAIDTILAANPGLEFILIGDSGQHDASVYLDAIERHPGRIRQVVLRSAGRIDDADIKAANALQEKDIDFFSGPTLEPLLNRVSGKSPEQQ
ncbi:phosphatase domain-containing protein [Hoeflea sp.]|uniref:phosphatase domain-containing protein n=1 Tax=Hoeflea sp. TaxID=1940281 RepID=UPI003B52D83C